MSDATYTGTLSYTGMLVSNAEARCYTNYADPQPVPLICFDILLDDEHHTPMHVQQRFPVGRFWQAQIAAKRYKKGQRVTVETSTVVQRLLAPDAAHIHLHTTEEAPCPPSP